MNIPLNWQFDNINLAQMLDIVEHHILCGSVCHLLDAEKMSSYDFHSSLWMSTLDRSEPCEIKKVVLVSKMTRYELEQHHNSHLDSSRLKILLKQRGSDYDSLKRYHNVHKNYENYIVNALEKLSIETRVVNRLNYSSSDVEWSNAIIPVGGDGTFLLAASRVANHSKPVIGFNSDPTRSEGFLCLPKKYCTSVDSIFKKILEGKMLWLFRSRIRITLRGINVSKPPIQLGEKETTFRSPDRLFKDDNTHTNEMFEEKVSPYRALNEVFIGECLSARVSYFELQFPNHPLTKVKSSGLCISTGTGSTSWHFSMNRMNAEDVQRVLEAAGISSDHLEDIISQCNQSLIFKPDDNRIVYTLRDHISTQVWPDPPGLPSRAFVNQMAIRSKCIDAGLVMDGSLLYPFNDGTVAILEVHPEDALRTVVCND